MKFFSILFRYFRALKHDFKGILLGFIRVLRDYTTFKRSTKSRRENRS